MALAATQPLSRIERTRRAAQAARARGHVAQPMPAQQAPDVIEDAYAHRLRTRVARAIRAAYAPLLRDLPALVSQARAERGDAADWRADATNSGRSASAAVKSAQRAMDGDLRSPEVREDVKGAAADVDGHNRVQLGKQVRAVLGINLAGNERLKPIIAGFAHENVKLIVGIGPKLAADIEGAVLKALTTGQLHEDLARVLHERFALAEDRAAAIAIDQVGKLNGQLNAQRQRDLGVTRFYWRTVGDERVRGNPNGIYKKADPSHYERNGKIYEFANPPRGKKDVPELPGVPVRCRCSAEGILEDIIGDASPAAVMPGADVDALEAEALRLQREVEAMMAGLTISPPLAPVIDLTAERLARAAAQPVVEPEPAAIAAEPVIHEQRPDVRALVTAPLVGRPATLGGGINASFTVDLRNPDGTITKAVWKPGKTARSKRTFGNIPSQGEHLRERAASVVAAQLGAGDLVAVTTTREVDGRIGSVQAWSTGASGRTTPATVDPDAMQRMRVFDFVIGNSDRHNGNVLWDGQGRPVLIDHGLTFPEGEPRRFKQPLGSFTAGPVGDAIAAQVAAIDEPALAKTLHEAGIGPEAIRHTLYRVRLLKEDPQILAGVGDPAADLKRWEAAATRAHLRLSDTSRAAADAVVESLPRSKKR